MFYNVESNGFKVSETHFRSTIKIEMLFYVVAISYYLSEVVGKISEELRGERRRSVFLKGVEIFEEDNKEDISRRNREGLGNFSGI